MATKEPLRRCVRCKTKKKGCSRGSPCERCAQAGLTAAECVYLESDLTYRNITPKRKDKAPSAPKVQPAKIIRSLSGSAADPGAIVRCSRCIRTARGCSHERPCQPCREHGLSEWECRYTSASSFKVRGPGAKGLRQIQSMEKIPIMTPLTTTAHDIAKSPKQARSLSTNSVPPAQIQAIIDQTLHDYRSPSPPTNISPISEPSNWRESRSSSPATIRTTALPVSAPVVEDIKPRSLSGTLSTPAVALMHSISQQSHATIPESSPAVFTDDYQSSPSPFNSPQFQSSPPVQFQSATAIGRPSSFPNEPAIFGSQNQVVYRPPASYTMQAQNRQFLAPQTQHGFAVPQNQAQYQQLGNLSQSPPYQQYNAMQTHPNLSSSPRHRAIPSPAPRYVSPGPYSIPQRNPHQPQESRLAHSSSYSSQHAIPIRRKSSQQQHYGSYTSYGASPNDPTTPDSFPDFQSGHLLKQSVKDPPLTWTDQAMETDDPSTATVFEWQEENH